MQDSVLPRGVGLRKPHISPYISPPIFPHISSPHAVSICVFLRYACKKNGSLMGAVSVVMSEWRLIGRGSIRQ